ncbi:hypothetical protein H4219_005498, partial [Mycoemilia scoparia]
MADASSSAAPIQEQHQTTVIAGQDQLQEEPTNTTTTTTTTPAAEKRKIFKQLGSFTSTNGISILYFILALFEIGILSYVYSKIGNNKTAFSQQIQYLFISIIMAVTIGLLLLKITLEIKFRNLVKNGEQAFVNEHTFYHSNSGMVLASLQVLYSRLFPMAHSADGDTSPHSLKSRKLNRLSWLFSSCLSLSDPPQENEPSSIVSRAPSRSQSVPPGSVSYQPDLATKTKSVYSRITRSINPGSNRSIKSQSSLHNPTVTSMHSGACSGTLEDVQSTLNSIHPNSNSNSSKEYIFHPNATATSMVANVGSEIFGDADLPLDNISLINNRSMEHVSYSDPTGTFLTIEDGQYQLGNSCYHCNNSPSCVSPSKHSINDTTSFSDDDSYDSSSAEERAIQFTLDNQQYYAESDVVGYGNSEYEIYDHENDDIAKAFNDFDSFGQQPVWEQDQMDEGQVRELGNSGEEPPLPRLRPYLRYS